MPHTFPTLYKRTSSGKVQDWKISVHEVPESPVGAADIVVEYGLVDGKRQVLRETISQGKNLGKSNETSPYQQAVLEATAKWEKQQSRKHYDLTPEGSESKRFAAPMLAKSYDKFDQKSIDWQTAYVQPKLDGFRCLAFCDGHTVKLVSREGQPIETMTHIVEELQTFMSRGDIFDGELFSRALTFQAIASRVKKLQPESREVQYHVYDCVSNKPFELRSDYVWDVIPDIGSVRLVDTEKLSEPEALGTYHQQCVNNGYEGAMLRHGVGGYEAGKRSNSLLKVKAFQDAEFEILDVREGRGTHAGAGICLCRTEQGAEFEVTAPGSFAEKAEFLANREKYLGKFLTVKFFEYTTSENPVPRFPVALRVRETAASPEDECASITDGVSEAFVRDDT